MQLPDQAKRLLYYGRDRGVGRGLGVGVGLCEGVAVGVGVGVAPDKQTGTFVIWPMVILKLAVAVSKVGFDTE